MIEYIIFTDGSCRGNGNGGIGVVWLKNGEKILEYSKFYSNTTNNKMELLTILRGISIIKKPIDSLEIVSDSQYAIGVLTKPWNPKKNIELIKHIRNVIKEKQKLVKTPIKWTHTRGHQVDDSENTKWNSYVDNLAQRESLYGIA